jgi:hypothetical protein
MSSVRNGAQWASGSSEPTINDPSGQQPPRHAGRVFSSTRGLRAIALAAVLTAVTVTGAPVSTEAASDYLLMPRSELLARPMSGTGWSGLKKVADQSLGTPDLCDQDEDHHLRTLGAALVYARTGSSSYGTKARAGVMAAIKTQQPGCNNAALSLGRQLAAYVFAADFANLSGSADTTFRNWLSGIRAKDIGGHSAWDSLVKTHRDAPNNWGAHAGASRIAASLYIGDSNDVAIAARITRGFLGDRSAYAGFRTNLDSNDWSWSCDPGSGYRPVNRPCTKSGINVDGAFIADISRGGSLRWPPGGTGVNYQVDAIAAVAIQVELLARNGHATAWDWSSKALRRAAQLIQRSDAAGGRGWNESSASSQIPWLLNKRYGSFLPTRHVPMGRGIGFADWLWGSTSVANLPAPAATTPWVRLSTTSSVPTSGTPVVIGWSLKSTSDGLGRYDLQMQKGSGSWSTLKLDSRTSTTRRVTLGSGEYSFRVRPVDRSGRVGAWAYIGSKGGWRVGDGSSWLGWTGSWSTASSSAYLDGKAHRSSAKGSTVSFSFTGSSIAWVAPVKSNLGQAHVFLDGKYVRTVDLAAGSSGSRRVVYAANVAHGKHTLKIRVVGTAGRPTIYVDGFYVVVAK